jgi:hypothetical protein
LRSRISPMAFFLTTPYKTHNIWKDEIVRFVRSNDRKELGARPPPLPDGPLSCLRSALTLTLTLSLTLTLTLTLTLPAHISNPTISMSMSTPVVPSLSSYHRLVVHRLADRFFPLDDVSLPPQVCHKPDI